MTNPIDPTRVRASVQPRAPAAKPAAPLPNTANPSTFGQVLKQQMTASGAVRFSAHALQRLESRKIQLDPSELARLETAVQAAADKGGRECLVLLDSAALVVNVRNRTVITAMTTDEAGQTVVTNIDSAVLAQSAPASETETNGLAPERGGLGAAERLTRRHSME